MATTIQISMTTKQQLQEQKRKLHASSYDEVIQGLLRKKTKVPKSMFGYSKGLGGWKPEDRLKFREL